MEGRIRVLVVDDSAYARHAVSRRLQMDPGIEVVGFGRNGAEAVEKVKLLEPDVVTLDVEMPGVDGISALRQIMLECPTPVVMLSSLTGEGAEATIKALELGAVDFFEKPSLAVPAGSGQTSNGLRHKIRVAAAARISRSDASIRSESQRQADREVKKARPKAACTSGKVVVIGSSTGGPKALHNVIPSLPADMPAGVLVVQHMPPGFTKSLSDRLNQISEIDVKEAEPGDLLMQGQAIVAPGGYHMVIAENGVVSLNQEPPVCGVRPSVDVTMESVARAFGTSSLGVVLTGMGSDGTRGASLIKAAGGAVISEDESTCAVYGMPKSVADAGLADRVAPLPQIVAEIVRMLENRGIE